MTRRERVLQAARHQESDIVPYQVELTFPALEKLIDYTKDPNYVEKIGNHLTQTVYADWRETEPGHWQDYWGVQWNRTIDKDIGVIEELRLPEPTLAGFKAPEIDKGRLRRECRQAIDAAGDASATFAIGFSMFERAWTLRGMENLLMDMVTDPGFVHGLLDLICEHNLELLEVALEYPFDGHYFGDDWGQQKGTIMGPGYWREFIKPRVARMYDRAKSKGRYVVQHSCGDIQTLYPDLIEMGLDFHQTFQPEIYDIKSVKKEFGKDLGFYGGISTQRDLPYVTPDEVKRITKETIEIMRVGGGYIASPTHAVPGDVPPENIVALVEALQEQ